MLILTECIGSQLLNYGQSSLTYYIRCHNCHKDYEQYPDSLWWREWDEDIRRAGIQWAQRGE